MKIDTFDGAKPRFLNRGKKRRSVLTLSIPRASARGVKWVDLAMMSEIYRNGLSPKSDRPPTSCPSAERLVRCLRSEMPHRERKAIIRHAALCSECLPRVRTFLNVMKSEEQFINEVQVVVKSEERRGTEKKIAHGTRMTLKYATALAVILACAISLYHLAFKNRRDLAIRGGGGKSIQLLAPSALRISADELHFRWRGPMEAKSYRLELYDKSLSLIWRSDPLSSLDVRPPADVVQRLTEGESYFVLIRATRADGRESNSNLKEFILSK